MINLYINVSKEMGNRKRREKNEFPVLYVMQRENGKRGNFCFCYKVYYYVFSGSVGCPGMGSKEAFYFCASGCVFRESSGLRCIAGGLFFYCYLRGLLLAYIFEGENGNLKKGGKERGEEERRGGGV